MADKGYLVLARKWRPQRFEDVVGQEHITRTLRNAIASGRIHHAFLFIGSRGIGKTTSARILAKALNCLSADGPTPEPCGTCSNCVSIGDGNNIDVLEIDGASNNGVDDIRELRENIRMVPTHGRYKVYIIDEVHQLSLPAFNALLKTLEEPPPHGVFILATTEAHKIPATVVSRCQRYDFRRVPISDIVGLLRTICDREKVAATDEALHAIARAAEGGIRDAESILDELITYCEGEITFKDVFDVLGLVDWDLLHGVCDAILDHDVGRVLTLVDEVVAGGKDLSQFVEDMLRYFRNLLVFRTAKDSGVLHLPEEELAAVGQRAKRFPLTHLIRLVEQFADLAGGYDSQIAQRIALESLLIKVAKVGVDVSIDTVLEKLLALEAGGLPQAVSTPAKAAVPQEPDPPPDPPEAAPAHPAPAAVAESRRDTANGDNLRHVWRRLCERLYGQDLGLSLACGQGQAVRLDGEVLVVAFPASHGAARGTVDRPENKRAIERALADLTRNVTALRTETDTREATPSSSRPQPAAGEPPFYNTANPEEAKAALAEPGVAAVLEVFKGRIARVIDPETDRMER